MGKYKEVREVIVNSLSDKQWHGVDEIQSKCEEEGINLEGNRGPIYNVVHYQDVPIRQLEAILQHGRFYIPDEDRQRHNFQ